MSHGLIFVPAFFIWYAPTNLFLNSDIHLRQSWAAPIQMIICLVLLLLDLGPSALAGFAFFILATPFQMYAMKRMFVARHKSMAWTDKRSKLLQELLGGMRVIKFFAWEIPFLERIFGYRQHEMG
jgi:ABC transporter transmembrane region